MLKVKIEFMDFDNVSDMQDTFISEEIISVETITTVIESGMYYDRKTGIDTPYQETETNYRVWYKELK